MSRLDIPWLQQRFPSIKGLRPLGPGGQKIVLLGTHDTDGPVVLKLYQMGADEELMLREVASPELVASHRVPVVFEAGKIASPVGEILWLREQRIPGMNLRERLAQGQLEKVEVLRLGLQMLQALAAAERARIVHRDVKPENIIARDDGSYWLIDFGLARHLNLTSITATGLAWGKGTPGYMPPEQWRNQKREIDGRTDLFGLGVTLYECVEGTNPLRDGARDALDILRRTERNPLPKLSRQIDAAGQFSELVSAMTRVLPNHRLGKVSEALEWMIEIAQAEGIPD